MIEHESGIVGGTSAGLSDSLLILTFHSLDDAASVISFPPLVFRRGLASLWESGYRTMGLEEAAECLRRGQPLPHRSFVITFDDGYRSVYQEAFPLLIQYGLSATVFLATGGKESNDSGSRLPSLNDRPMLAWHEIQEMQEAGIDFGAHTLSHSDLPCLAPEQAEAEIIGSKQIIEDKLGTRVACFAYPYGHYDVLSRSIAQRYFACACSDRLGLANARSDLYALERVDAFYLRSDRLFDMIPTRWLPWYIAMRSIPRGTRRLIQDRWHRRWPRR